MSLFYELVGRVVVRRTWRRWGREITIAGAIGVVLIGIGGYLVATREPARGLIGGRRPQGRDAGALMSTWGAIARVVLTIR